MGSDDWAWWREEQRRRDEEQRERDEKIARSVRYSVILTIWEERTGSAGPKSTALIDYLDPTESDIERMYDFMRKYDIPLDSPILFWHCHREAE